MSVGVGSGGCGKDLVVAVVVMAVVVGVRFHPPVRAAGLPRGPKNKNEEQ